MSSKTLAAESISGRMIPSRQSKRCARLALRSSIPARFFGIRHEKQASANVQGFTEHGLTRKNRTLREAARVKRMPNAVSLGLSITDVERTHLFGCGYAPLG